MTNPLQEAIELSKLAKRTRENYLSVIRNFAAFASGEFPDLVHDMRLHRARRRGRLGEGVASRYSGNPARRHGFLDCSR